MSWVAAVAPEARYELVLLGIVVLAVLFALFGTLAGFGIGNGVQAHELAKALNISLGVPPLATGIVVAAITFAVWARFGPEPAMAFALWTTANLMPRARTHLAWYREEFPDYPPERKAVIPFVL